MNKTMKILVYLGIITSIVAIGLTSYNKSIEKKAVNDATILAGEAFKAKAEHPKDANRIIIEKYLRDEKELLDVTRQALPLLTKVGDYDVVELLSVRAYYGEDKENPQFYDIKFKDIKKIKWETIRSFDDFLNEINKF